MSNQLRIVLRGETNPDTVGPGRADIIRKRLSPDEVMPAGIRFVTPDEEHPDGIVQQLAPDGETWIDQPLLDPRHSPIYAFPPRGSSGDTTRCDAAANLAGALHSVIDILIAAPNVLSAINSWLAYVARFMPEIGFIITILQYIYDLLATLKPYLEDAFTTEVYGGIECFMYCRMDDSGVLTAETLGDLIGDICGAYEETVCTVCQAILQTWWSEVGCSNAAAIGSLTGDCTDCGCTWCRTIDFNLTDGDWLSRTVANTPCDDWGGTWLLGQGWLNTTQLSLSIEFPIPAGTHVTRMAFTSDGGGSGVAVAAAAYINADLSGGVIFRVNDFDTGPIDFTMPADAYLLLIIQPVSGGGTCADHTIRNIDHVTVWGDGDDTLTTWDIC